MEMKITFRCVRLLFSFPHFPHFSIGSGGIFNRGQSRAKISAVTILHDKVGSLLVLVAEASSGTSPVGFLHSSISCDWHWSWSDSDAPESSWQGQTVVSGAPGEVSRSAPCHPQNLSHWHLHHVWLACKCKFVKAELSRKKRFASIPKWV